MSHNICKEKYNAPGASALYVHVPFCAGKCAYCDFYSVRFSEDAAAEYVECARRELAGLNRLSVPADSVYIGGGTPTVLGPELLRRLLSDIRPLLGPDTEFTLEANPETVTPEVIDVVISGGVNRASIGAQSFKPEELKILHRGHGPGRIHRSVEMFRRAGIKNISLDLIYGVPGQTHESFEESLAEALEGLSVDHLSCYALSIEEATPMEKMVSSGRLTPVDEEIQEKCYRAAIARCRQAGLEHYEISNFARPNLRCRHNMVYWRNLPYLGVGPAAAGYMSGVRCKNIPDLDGYISAIRCGQRPPRESEHLTGYKAVAEAMMLSLRLIDGIDRADFKRRYGVDAADVSPDSISRYVRLGAMVVTSENIRLDSSGLFVADSILSDILAEAEMRDSKLS